MMRPITRALPKVTVSSVGRVAPVASFHGSSALDYRILASDPIDPICEQVLLERGHEATIVDETLSKEELLEMIPRYHGLIVRSGTTVTEEVLEAGRKLRIIGRAGTGVDNIDQPAATRRGILVMNTPGGNTTSTAELTMSHIMALSRNIPQASTSLKEGRWDRKLYTGSELHSKTIGIIGLGRIGQEVARWCQSFGMNVVGFDPIMPAAATEKLGIKPVSLDGIWAHSDYITVHTPMTDLTRNIINKDSLAACKDGVRIINCARGGIVNEEDLLAALEAGKVAGAALDVYSQEPPPESSYALLKHPKVICTPHLGASTTEAQVKVARDIATQMCDALAGEKYVGVTNAQSVAKAVPVGLVPYKAVATSLGRILAQTMPSSCTFDSAVVTFQGELADTDSAVLIKNDVLKGFISAMKGPGVDVNDVNTPVLAEEMGLKATEVVETTPPSSGYSNTVTGMFTYSKNGEEHTTTVVATINRAGKMRLLRCDDYNVDIEMADNMVMFFNYDRPGVLSHVTSCLAEANVNIGSFATSRGTTEPNALGAKSMSVFTTDAIVNNEVLSSIIASEDITEANSITLPDVLSSVDSLRRRAVPSHGVPYPEKLPSSAQFGSGPTKKRPGWTLECLSDASLGRSHRSKVGKAKLALAIEETKRLLNIPEDYRVGIVPASDTGAVEMCLWSMLGERPVDVVHFESFGSAWLTDIKKQLALDFNEHGADYGSLPDLSKVNTDNDVVFPWNGTTSGVRVPNGDWIADDRKGLTICDATSAVFAMDLPWEKLDVTTYSWQKVLGGEGAHGMLILSPRAVERLTTYAPPRPLPKIFRMTKAGADGSIKLQEGIFEGSTINTPSMLCVEDYLDALRWVDDIGGVKSTRHRADCNLRVIEDFVKENDWIEFLAEDPETISNTSVCLKLPELTKEQIAEMVFILQSEGAAVDIGAYRDAPAGLRIWCGATVEEKDVRALMPWLHFAYMTVTNPASE